MPNKDKPLLVVEQTPNLRERTVQVLRDAIINMHLKPGERLVERKLQDQTGVSRTCVREALRQLETEELIERIPNRGMFVATVSSDKARKIYEVRAALEATMARYFVERASEQQFAALENAYEQVKRTIFGRSVRAYVRALDNFSEALQRGAGNEVAHSLLSRLSARITYLRALTARAAPKSQKENTLKSLSKIVEAVTSRDAEAAQERCREYVERSASFAVRVLSESEDNFERARSSL